VTEWIRLAVTSIKPQRQPRLKKKTTMILADLACLAKTRDRTPPARIINMEMKN